MFKKLNCHIKFFLIEINKVEFPENEFWKNRISRFQCLQDEFLKIILY